MHDGCYIFFYFIFYRKYDYKYLEYFNDFNKVALTLHEGEISVAGVVRSEPLSDMAAAM